MNADGFVLLERVKQGDDPDLIEQIERCARYARTKKYLELIEYRKLFTGEKVYAETAMVHLLKRLVANLS